MKELSYISKKAISKIFYEKFSIDEYFAPKIDKIYVDTPYESRQIGNVVETKFEHVNKIAGKEIEMDYRNGNRTCDLHNEFTKDGELITKCKDGEIKKESD